MVVDHSFTSLHHEHSLLAFKSPRSTSINAVLLECSRGLPFVSLVMLNEQTMLHSQVCATVAKVNLLQLQIALHYMVTKSLESDDP